MNTLVTRKIISREELRALPNKVYSKREILNLALQHIIDPIYTQVLFTAEECGRTTQTFYPNRTYFIHGTKRVTIAMESVVEELTRLFPGCEFELLQIADSEEGDEPTGIKISW
jgi:hypothetical protein